ncbi:exonuclease domain-containing protein [Acinetobacter radioresistens]|uniref:exonuclease domain-containing protein n=1 Tax=Acinetobacter radioresistens TaxID=40216 RepID=UPI0022451140|nr:exonuclease domain-containing protein [Acinetobacter radioresistens]MCX0337413.1 exonuclease domain-containing protein [Acinetobacter radioresistens]
MDFVALDVETANSDPKSICQIGVAVFKNGDLVETWSSLINPQSHFDFMNSSIHGITEENVRDAPIIADVKTILDQLVGDNIVAIYSGFDKVALEKNFPQINYSWLDITKVVRRTWEQVAYSGYGLANVCRLNNINIVNHHDALADAIAAGRVLICALNAKQLQLDDCRSLIRTKISTLIAHGKMSENPNPINVIIEGGNPEGEWFGDVICFTGELRMPRIEASIKASQLGFDVGKSVTKKTNYLVTGLQDSVKLKGKSISAKEEKALALIKKGQDIVVISEEDFFYMVDEN